MVTGGGQFPTAIVAGNRHAWEKARMTPVHPSWRHPHELVYFNIYMQLHREIRIDTCTNMGQYITYIALFCVLRKHRNNDTQVARSIPGTQIVVFNTISQQKQHGFLRKMVDSTIEARGSQDKPRAFSVPEAKVLTKAKQGGGVSRGQISNEELLQQKIKLYKQENKIVLNYNP